MLQNLRRRGRTLNTVSRAHVFELMNIYCVTYVLQVDVDSEILLVILSEIHIRENPNFRLPRFF